MRGEEGDLPDTGGLRSARSCLQAADPQTGGGKTPPCQRPDARSGVSGCLYSQELRSLVGMKEGVKVHSNRG